MLIKILEVLKGEKMREIKFYGDTTDRFPFTGKEMQQYKEQVKRIRSYHRLTVMSFVLMVAVIVETLFFIAIQIALKSSQYAGLLGIILEILTLAVIVSVVYVYKKSSPDFRAADFVVIISAELLFGFSEFIVYVYKQPVSLYIAAGVSFVLVLYILLAFKAKLKQKVAFSVIPIVLLAACSFLSINSSVYTARYVYISSDGYYNEASNNDITHFYYLQPVDSRMVSDSIVNTTKSYASDRGGIYSVEEFNGFCKSYNTSLNMNELLNFSRTYDEDFFKNNCLYIAPIELDTRNDRVEFKGFSYALSSQKPCVKYSRDKMGKTDGKSTCLMLIEVPLLEDNKLNGVVGLKCDDVIQIR